MLGRRDCAACSGDFRDVQRIWRRLGADRVSKADDKAEEPHDEIASRLVAALNKKTPATWTGVFLCLAEPENPIRIFLLQPQLLQQADHKDLYLLDRQDESCSERRPALPSIAQRTLGMG